MYIKPILKNYKIVFQNINTTVLVYSESKFEQKSNN